MRPEDMSPAERFSHGTRSRYTSGCRCAACRKANSIYNRSRVGAPFNGLVDATPAREHLKKLSAAGVGRRAVRSACDVALSVIADVRNGSKTRIRADTARRLLSVDDGALADSALVPAGPTREAVRELRRLGWTKGRISQKALGNKVAALQLVGRKVLARTQLAVLRLLALEKQRRDARCPRCARDHSDDETARRWCLENLSVPLDDLEAS